jgi:hypothetical protein
MGYFPVLSDLVGWNHLLWLIKIELELGLIFGTRKKPDLGPEIFEDKMFLGKKKGLKSDVHRIAS